MALHAHRTAAMDPHVREVSREQALVVRLGVGDGEQVADGRWTEAIELAPFAPGRRQSVRAGVLRPQERLAALLSGRDVALAARGADPARAPGPRRRPRSRGGAPAACRTGGRARRARPLGRPARAWPPASPNCARPAAPSAPLPTLRCEGGLDDDATDGIRRARPARVEAALRAAHRAPASSSAYSAPATTASSSATTSPSSLTARARVPRRRALRDDRDLRRRPGRVTPGSCAIGWTSSEEPTHSSTSAPAAKRVGALQRALRQELAEQHDVGLQRLAAVAGRDADRRRLQPRADLVERVPRAAGQARRVLDRPVDLDQLRASRPCGAACRCSG